MSSKQVYSSLISIVRLMFVILQKLCLKPATGKFIQFARIEIEKILNRPITKFYNSDDVNVIAAELRFISFYKKQNLL